jgi:hypothetical protein
MRRAVRNLLTVVASACVAIGCSQAAEPSSRSGGGGGTYDVPVPQAATPDPCDPIAEGCPCVELGQKAACKAELLVVGTYQFCGGERTCDAQTGTWSACVPTIAVVGAGSDADGGLSSASGKH